LPTDARVALGLGYFAGLRRAEIVSLRGDQVGRDRRLVAFTRKGGGEDTFDYGDVLDHFAWSMPHLEPGRLETPLRRLALQRGPDSLMPWQSLRPQALNRRLTRWLDEAGRPGAFGPHMLRHSFATNLLRSGVPLDVACDLCNHSSPTITMRYVHTGGGRLAALRRVDGPQAQAL
jgi:site-specific recombinase XerD